MERYRATNEVKLTNKKAKIMSISNCVINAFFVETKDPQSLVHTFYRREKVYNAADRTSDIKGVPIIVITREATDFAKGENYLFIGNFHSSLHDTLVLYPFKTTQVSKDFDVNITSFVGRLGKDPQVKYSESGSMSVHASLAHAEYLGGVNYDSKEGNQKTVWTNITFIPKNGQNPRGEAFMTNVSKQTKRGLYGITGAFHVESFTDKETGEQRFNVKVLVNNVEFLTSFSEGESKPKVIPDVSSLQQFGGTFDLTSDALTSGVPF
jgi:single-strand DNA-binding protein